MVPLKQQDKPVDQQALKNCSKQRGMLKNKSQMEKNNGPGGGKDGKNKNQRENDPNQKKKIDFKEKAIKAKENSVKKVIAKNMKSSGGKGPNTGGG